MRTENIKLFNEMDNKLQNESKPSIYMAQLSSEEEFKKNPLNMLSALKQTEQSPKHHPEGNVWNHTMLVLDLAAEMKEQSQNPRVLMWAALLHDIGKPGTTRKQKDRITSYDHDKLGAKLVRKFLSELTEESELIESVAALVRWHMQIMFIGKNMPYADMEGMKKEVDVSEIAILGFCDRMGRLNSNRETEEENIRSFMRKCRIGSDQHSPKKDLFAKKD